MNLTDNNDRDDKFVQKQIRVMGRMLLIRHLFMRIKTSSSKCN